MKRLMPRPRFLATRRVGTLVVACVAYFTAVGASVAAAAAVMADNVPLIMVGV